MQAERTVTMVYSVLKFLPLKTPEGGGDLFIMGTCLTNIEGSKNATTKVHHSQILLRKSAMSFCFEKEVLVYPTLIWYHSRDRRIS